MMALDEGKLINQLQTENRILKAALDKISEGVHVTNSDGVTIFYNAAVSNFEGVEKKEVEGKKIIDVYSMNDFDQMDSQQLSVIESGEPAIERQVEYFGPEGKKVNVVLSTYPYFENNKLIAVFSISEDISRLKETIDRTFSMQKKINYQVKKILTQNGTIFSFDNIVGESFAIRQTVDLAKKYAMNKSSVLIYGETGTGKELFAQGIHNAGIFVNGPFVPINCAAIPETLLESILFGSVKGAYTGASDNPGLFEQAENGTLFLDEINSMGMNLQAKLLRVLQEKEVQRLGENRRRKVNCRVISSANKDPLQAVKDNEIRQDLYFRLSAAPLFVPPLREREKDLEILVDYFIGKYNLAFGTNVQVISPTLTDVLMGYSWPGNVRELEHVIESAMNLVDSAENMIREKHLPPYLLKQFGISQNSDAIRDKVSKTGGGFSDSLLETNGLDEIMEYYEKNIIQSAYQKNNRNMTKTAEQLKLLRQTLRYKLQKYGIEIRKSPEGD